MTVPAVAGLTILTTWFHQVKNGSGTLCITCVIYLDNSNNAQAVPSF